MCLRYLSTQRHFSSVEQFKSLMILLISELNENAETSHGNSCLCQESSSYLTCTTLTGTIPRDLKACSICCATAQPSPFASEMPLAHNKSKIGVVNWTLSAADDMVASRVLHRCHVREYEWLSNEFRETRWICNDPKAEDCFHLFSDFLWLERYCHIVPSTERSL